MSQAMTPIVLGAAGLLVLVLLGGSVLIYHFRRRFVLRPKQLKVLNINVPSEEGTVRWEDFFRSVASPKYPVVLEYAAQTIGDTAGMYCVVPNRALNKVTEEINRIWPQAKIHETDHYNVFNHTGSTLGMYFKKRGNGLREDVPELKFRSVNEIGEGAMVQLIAVKEGEDVKINLRATASAPDNRRVQEIMKEISKSLHQLSGSSPKKQEEFLADTTARSFSEEISTSLDTKSIAEIWSGLISG